MRVVCLKFIPALVIVSLIALYYSNLSRNKFQFQQNRIMGKKLNPEKKQMIALGDCRVMFDIDPSIVSEKSGLNFAFPGNSYSKKYFHLAESKLNEKSDILIGISSESLTMANGNKAIENYVSEFRSKNIMIRNINIFLEYVFPKLSLKDFFFGRLFLGDSTQFNSVEIKDNGTYVYLGDYVDELRASEHYRNVFKKNKIDFNIIKEMIDFSKRMISKGHRVYFFDTPVHESVLKEEEKLLEQTQKVINFLYKSLKETGACHLTHNNDFKTWDGEHLLPNEAKRFSKLLGEKIRNQDCEK
jgi:hypothetical protein